MSLLFPSVGQSLLKCPISPHSRQTGLAVTLVIDAIRSTGVLHTRAIGPLHVAPSTYEFPADTMMMVAAIAAVGEVS